MIQGSAEPRFAIAAGCGHRQRRRHRARRDGDGRVGVFDRQRRRRRCCARRGRRWRRDGVARTAMQRRYVRPEQRRVDACVGQAEDHRAGFQPIHHARTEIQAHALRRGLDAIGRDQRIADLPAIGAERALAQPSRRMRKRGSAGGSITPCSRMMACPPSGCAGSAAARTTVMRRRRARPGWTRGAHSARRQSRARRARSRSPPRGARRR